MSELRYAFRMLARTPASTCLSVVILAFGVTAVVSAFSVLRAVALDPLPYEAPENLYEVRVTLGSFDFELTRVHLPVFEAWRAGLPTIGLAGSNEARHETTMYVSETDTPVRVLGAFVSPEYFEVLGARPSRGRTFEASDVDAPVAVVTHRLRQAAFGGREHVVGRTLRINDEPHEIVGVLPPGFEAPRPVGAMDVADPLDIFVPVRSRDLVPRETFDRTFVRLSELDDPASVAAMLSRLHTPSRSPLQEAQGGPPAVVRLAPITEVVLGDARSLVRVLGLVVAMTLLLTWASLVLVQSARMAPRRREAAILSALGASRRRLTRSYSLEGVVLAAAGAIGALLAITWVHVGIQTLLPSGTPRLDSFRVDPRLVLVAIGAAVGLGLGASAVPAVGVARGGAATPLPRAGTVTSTRTERTWTAALVVLQVGLMFSLTVGLGLLARSVARLYESGAGIRNLDAVVVDVHRRRTAEGPVPYEAFFTEVLTRVRAVPGVRQATMTSSVPFRPRDYRGPEFQLRIVDGSYFETVGLDLMRGRTFDGRDLAGSPPVAVIDRALAELRFSERDPVGSLLDDRGAGREPRTYTVVGVVESARHGGLGIAAEPTLYVPFSQRPDDRMSLLVRGGGGTTALVDAVREAVLAADPEQPLGAAATLRELRDRSEAVGRRRFHLWFLAVAGGFAALIATLGIYGTIAQSVVRRGREIGIRVAFGAGSAHVVRMVLGSVAALVGGGVLLGMLAAAVLGRALASVLFEVQPYDPMAMGVAVVAVLVLAVAGTLVPVRRALAIDPAQALRMD